MCVSVTSVNYRSSVHCLFIVAPADGDEHDALTYDDVNDVDFRLVR